MGRKPVRRSSTNRYLRQRRSLDTAGPVTSLINNAGLTERPTVEQLERRQMLFSLTVTPDLVDPNTGLGTINAFIGYTLPYIASNVEIPDPQDPQGFAEDFSDEPYGPINPGGTNLQGSGIRISHSIFPATDIFITANPQTVDNQDRWMQVNQNSSGEFVRFQFFTPPETPPGAPLIVTSAQITFDGLNAGDNTGLLTDAVRVDLTRGTAQTVIASFTGAALRALFTGNPLLGTGVLNLQGTALDPGFDSVRITMVGQPPQGANTAYRVTDISYTVAEPRFATLIEPLIWGARIVLTGPVGATATFADLYGRDMHKTIILGRPGQGNLAVDANDNGIPDFNDGIGSIRMANTDSRTALSMWGGTIAFFQGQPPNDADFIEGNFAFRIIPDLVGNFDDIEDLGFAYAWDLPPGENQFDFAGLPPGPGSVVIGSPFVRDQNNYAPGLLVPGASNTVTTGFTRSDQGIFVEDGGNLGSIYIHGILHGSSNFKGFVDRIYVGYLVGSISVAGDLGALITGTDAGQWAPDPDFSLTDPNARLDQINKTGSQLVVGRTVGEFAVAGRNLVDVMVVGDLNNPATRPPRDVFTYYEKEFVLGINPNVTPRNMVNQNLDNNAYVARNPEDQFNGTDQAMVFGPGFFRNDQIMGAEWVGSISSGVRIKGNLSGRDPSQGEDTNDVFAFASDGTQDILIEAATNAAAPYIRVVDDFGRVLAAPQLTDVGTVTRLRFTPKGPGVYYLVIADPSDGATADNNFGNVPYTISITGMAVATLGALRSGGGAGFTDINSGQGNSTQVLAGNIGSLRVGTGLVIGGAVVSPSEIINTIQDDDDSMSWYGGAYSAPGNLYNITAGSDIGNPSRTGGGNGISIIIGGNLGTLFTGLSPVFAGGGSLEGDFNFITMQVGGRIGSINIRGGIGVDQDAEDNSRYLPIASFSSITTGTAGGAGDIGFIRVGANVAGDSFQIRTSPGSIVGSFLVAQDGSAAPLQYTGIFQGLQGVPIFTGAGSDVRFVDTPRIDLIQSLDITTPIIGGQVIELTDDGGSRIQISVENAADGANLGAIRVLPIDGSQGVAIGRITVNLAGGATLRIKSLASGVGTPVSIGRIELTGTGPASAIQIDGQVRVDVFQVISTGVLDTISNTTGGDMVAIDVGGLNTLDLRGDLGRTEVPAWGPTLIGPFLGLDGALNQTVGGPLGVGAGITGTGVEYYFGWDGTGIFRPLNAEVYAVDGAFLEDIGSPLDGYLNGLVVRSGNVASVQVTGVVGDVILQDPAGELTSLRANSDRVTPVDRFEGIAGHIFAFDLVDIDIGDGLLASTNSPLQSTGIVALNDINNITSSRASGVFIAGTINALNAQVDAGGGLDGVDGLGNIQITNGIIRDAHITSEDLDGFWEAFNYDDGLAPLGDLGNIRLTNTTFFRSTARGVNINNFTLSGPNGFFDASVMEATGLIDNVSVTGFRNSTLTGSLEEIALNRILGARDLNRLTASQDIADLTIDITGSVRQSISATNITRSVFEVDNEIKSLTVTNDIRATSINAGNLPTVTIGRNLQSSTVFASGQLNITAGNKIANSQIAVTGPGGTIGTITAPNLISGSISSAGNIGTIIATAGDVIATITTTNGGTVTALTAGRDLNVVGDVSGSVGTLTAGRNFGNAAAPGVFLVRGTLASASVANGQLYSDIRVGQAISGAVTVGSATNKVGANLVGTGSIIAFGPIATVTINGDFDGDIISFSGGIASVAITNGSLLPGNTIAAYNASLASVVITNGSLYGNVHADNDITLLRVIAGADGVFGDIGVNPTSSSAVSYDSKRNQLPLGVAPDSTVQGPIISAGRNIVSIQVPGGSVFETYFVAGQNINSIVIAGTVQNDFNTLGISSAFIAGDSIDLVTISGGVNNTAFVSGLVSLGADGRLGGTGANADAVKSGSIKTINISNGMVDGKFSAGIDPGFDGIYNTSDDRSVQGISTIGNINLSGPVGNVSVFADVLPSNIANDNRFTRGGTNLPNTNPQIDSGSGTPGTSFSGSRTFNNVNGANLTFNFSGPGQAFFNPATGTLVLRNTTSATNITVSSSTGVINNIDVVTNDDASLGNVTFNGRVTGDSDLVVDGNVAVLTYGDFEGTGTISIGGDVTTATFANFKGGFFEAKSVPTFRINGQFGDLNTAIFNEAKIQLLAAGAISIGGQAAGVISVDRDATSLAVSGPVDRAAFRFGRSLGSFTSPNFSRSFLSAGDNIGPITIGGDVFQSNISAGADLGRDAAPGGTGFNADVVSSGNIGAVMIAGNFNQSSLTAGYLRGADGYFGTSDDLIAGGRSTIASVTIGGTQTGSSRGSESFRIASNGTLGPVTIGGSVFNGTRGNFGLEALNLQPNSLQVSDLSVVVTSGVSTANLKFNQPVDSTSVSAALSVSEVRGTGDVVIRLVEGIDYTVSYDNVTNTVRVQFNTAVTSRNLPVTPGVPGPGVYRFEVDQQKIRARLTGIQLDGDGDGMSEVNDDYSADTIVGDAGDRVSPGVVVTGPANNPHRVDLYGPTSLDFILDNNKTSDGLPDPNVTYTVRGFIGDHPDNNINFFGFGGDLDVYSITLQAGQILRLGALGGTAILASVNVFDPNGIAFNPDSMVAVFTDRTDVNALTFGSDFLIKQTGTYLISIGDADDIADPGTITNPPPPPGGVGAYNFTVTIFDDGDSGFNASTDSGNGSTVVNAPAPSMFAGNDQVFGTADDLTSVTIGAYVFTYSKGPDNLPNTADDIVTGSNKDSVIVSTRDGTGRMVSTISSAIGPAGHAGVPSESAADVDIFRLNNGQPIVPGTKMTITVKLTDLGADLGSATAGSTGETRGAVQFALFDISNSTAIDDGTLVFSPTDFTANGGPKNTVIASNGSTTYGYDANGDFYITFNSPDRIDLPGNPAVLAVYIQGVRNTDYQIEVVTHGTAPTTTRQTQNFLIETNGGLISWLEAAGQSTSLRPFMADTLGFTGTINGIAVQDYIINNLIAQLNSLFQSGGPGTGFDVHFSANPADFEFQQVSTVFLTSEMDPVNAIFNPFAFEPLAGFGGASTVVQPYGYSEHSDALNADLEDEAVVFVPAFALQGFSPGKADVDQFVQATTAAIARRAGELMGLRVTEAYAPNTTAFDPFAANSVDDRPGATRAYTLPNFNRGLSDALDSVNRTDFYLGQQNARSLLDKVLKRI